MSAHAAQLLRVRHAPTHMQIKHLSGDIVAAKGVSWLQVTSYHDDKVTECIGAYIVPSMLSALPKQRIDSSRWHHLRKLALADPKFNIPDRVDILLGADFYSRVIENGVRKKRGAPTAQNTSFGWIVFGGYSESVGHASIVNATESAVSNDELMEMLKKFWEFEQVPDKRYRTQEEQMCEDIFTQSIALTTEGRYIARMPLQPNAPLITGTYDLAYARVIQMEKRFAKDPALKTKYIDFMREYASLGHMIAVPEEECKSDTAVYIPHHAAGTAKFRIVFDGSARKKGNLSINEIQLNGEKTQPELITILMRFRTYKIALTSDIAKMYRQILIAKDQQDLQRILWRESAHPRISFGHTNIRNEISSVCMHTSAKILC